MRRQTYLSLIIVCVVLSQGIAVLPEENIDESSDLLVRKKRVIDETPSGNVPGSLHRFPYIVNILKDGFSHCAGSILESDIILTVPDCIRESIFISYSILSGSPMRNRGTPHNITNRISNETRNLALLKIHPPIDLQRGSNAKIELFTGPVPPNSYARFAGWGCNHIGPGNELSFPQEFMVTRLPLISQQECAQTHNGPIHITFRHICTLDRSKRRGTCIGDQGGPLIFNNQLIGILIYRTLAIGIYPDVFANLNNPTMRNWINTMTDIIRN